MKNFNLLIEVFLVSMTPIVECRASIPLGLAQGLPLWEVLLISISGNTLMGISLFYLLSILESNLLKREPFKSWHEKYLKRALNRFTEHSFGLLLSLTIFIATPLPGTGAFTGAFLAKFFKFSGIEAFLSIFLGVFGASIIVSLLTNSVMAVIPN